MKWYWYLLALIITMSAIAYTDAAVIIGDSPSGIAGVSIDTPVQPTDFSIQNTNSSDFWDNLDVPTDIPGSEFWYNFSLTSTGIDTNFSEGGVAYGPILMDAENQLQFNSTNIYFFFNRTNNTVQLVAHDQLQQSWGSSTFFPVNATFAEDLEVVGEIKGSVGTIESGDLNVSQGNIEVGQGNVTADVFKGTIDCTNITGGSDADYCVDATAGNETFNQSLTDSLYADILWNYNQTIGAINYADDTFGTFNYNMSLPYDTFNYNQTLGSFNFFTDNIWSTAFNVTFDQRDSDTLPDYTNIAFYNDTNEFAENQNFTENITVLDRICFDVDCDRYIFANGSSIIIQG